MNRTLQDRLIKDLRLEGICTMDDGNAFLPRFMERYNRQFAITPARPDDLHRSMNHDRIGLRISCANANSVMSARS